MNITLVAGARPNFIKVAPIIEAITRQKARGMAINYRLIHTGQHYDTNLSARFFEELNIPIPDLNLEVGSGTQAEQTAAIMIGFEKELHQNPCDLVIVVGDVTSTMACAIVAKKAHIQVAHVEAGIRSGDLNMPEEINRMVTDSITDYFFTTSTYANAHLKRLGVPESKIFFVGNVMIDTLMKHAPRFKRPPLWEALGLSAKQYFVLTLHRPHNVDHPQELDQLIARIVSHSQGLPLIFPVHPRTQTLLAGLQVSYDNLHLIAPLGYLEFNYLVKHALAVITDSGGITEEATVMHVPCITLRDTTERPETCAMGTNILVGNDPKLMETAFNRLYSGQWQKGVIPELWDGQTATRIVDHLIALFKSS
ncbi:non-hydrolyzing UDP-N-acetylglucosamine 2-epimerase [Aestuariivivens sediminis]|uniref:non-hydrolyzing UDP-N-acetylglucosamine 2-epimerase n=1 Tax=Aestuariivivens sediminis TaxID=2913557 RepID=UPI001F561600|nr:UDP-N-acetylglucosamine 2-epimerase (non-hydrolyzing) [Aestuariivivens sediminis]